MPPQAQSVTSNDHGTCDEPSLARQKSPLRNCQNIAQNKHRAIAEDRVKLGTFIDEFDMDIPGRLQKPCGGFPWQLALQQLSGGIRQVRQNDSPSLQTMLTKTLRN
jgi:hypothetical protein